VPPAVPLRLPATAVTKEPKQCSADPSDGLLPISSLGFVTIAAPAGEPPESLHLASRTGGAGFETGRPHHGGLVVTGGAALQSGKRSIGLAPPDTMGSHGVIMVQLAERRPDECANLLRRGNTSKIGLRPTRRYRGRRWGVMAALGVSFTRSERRFFGHSTMVAALVLGLVVTVTTLGPADAATGFAGSSWTTDATFVAPDVTMAVSCPSTSECIAVGINSADSATAGTIAGTNDGGSTWSREPVPNATGPLYGISCSTTSDCVVVGASTILVTTDGGTTWSSRKIATKSIFNLNGVSCYSTDACMAVGSIDKGKKESYAAILVTANGGTTWKIHKVGGPSLYPTFLSAISCISTGQCVLVGTYTYAGASHGFLEESTGGGTTWGGPTIPASITGLNGVSCSSGADCTAVGITTTGENSVGAAISTSDGSPWTLDNVPKTDELSGVSCPSATDCVAAGFDAILASTDGGGTWSAQSEPPGASELSSVSCNSDSDCVAVGPTSAGTAINTSDGGTSWTLDPLPNAAGRLSGVSCVSTQTCVATDGVTILTSHDGGDGWTNQSRPSESPRGGGLNGISCSSTNDCVIVGLPFGLGDVQRSTDAGTTWTPEVPPGGGGLASVSCASTDDCTAVGYLSVATSSDGGMTWTSQQVPNGAAYLASVSCASPENCVAVGESTIFTSADGGITWTSRPVPHGASRMAGVSCPSTEDCVAVGGTTVLSTTDDGVTWAQQTIPVGDSVESVSCPSPTECMAVGGTDIVSSTDSGVSWTNEVAPSEVSYLSSVSCATVDTCEAVGEDSQNDAIIIGSTDLQIAMNPTATTPTVNPSSAVEGSPIRYSATVSPTSGSGIPTGTVTFTVGAVTMCAALLSEGSGSCVDATAPAGIDTVTASYGGDATDSPSEGTTTLDVGSGVDCVALSGSLSKKITIAKCGPTSPKNKSLTGLGSALSSGGALTWAKSGQTTIVALTSHDEGQASCKTGSTAIVSTGTVTGGTSTYTSAGDHVSITVCETTRGAVTLMKGTTASL